MNAEEKELLRHVVLEALVLRYPTAKTAKQLCPRVEKEVDFLITEEDVSTACAFLKELNHAESVNDELGSSTYWKATAHGVRSFERSSNPQRPSRD